MSRRTDVDELLAPEHLSGNEREEVLASVLRGVGGPSRRPLLRRPFFWALSGAAAVAVGAVLLVARPPARDRDDHGGDGMVVKGKAATAGRPMIEISCSRGTLTACPRGSTLVFRIDRLRGSGALTAWADPVAGAGAGAPGRERIWYFSADDQPVAIDGAGGSLIARKAIEVGPEHAVGAYQVHVLLTDRPIARREALSAAGASVRAEAVIRLEVIP
jgi:hypothetical protein